MSTNLNKNDPRLDDIPIITVAERQFLQTVVFHMYKLRPIYYWQTLSLWIRIKPKTPPNLYKVAILCCFNIAIHFIGPQSVIKHIYIFRCMHPKGSTLYSLDNLRSLCIELCNYVPASHLLPWQIARRVQWHIVLRLLNGRIQ